MIHNTLWKEALKHTNIIRPRIRALSSIEDTKLPYIFLAQSAVNPHTCVVRQGNVIVKKPTILLPPNLPQLKGFELQEKPYLREFLLVRQSLFLLF
jgi:hypothetical protein